MVAHNGGSYLPRTLAGLEDQTRPVDAAIGVDTGSKDNSLRLLEDAFGSGAVTKIDGGRPGFGAAVKAGLRALESPHTDHDSAGPNLGGSSDRDTGQEWIWLLHDDSAPAPEALAELLHAVERAPSVTVAGCKLLDRKNPRHLVDVGLSTSWWAERLTLIEADELDQGQYDGRTDMFAVNSAGMLVRRDVWDQLEGFDPALPGTGDDVDFCWRNRLAGNRVVVVPSARMFHPVDRPHALGNPLAARKAQVHLRLKHAAWWAVPLQWFGALLGSLFTLLLSVIAKDPGHGVAQLGATLAALGRPLAIYKARRTAARTRKLRRGVIRGLQTSRRDVWAHRRSLMEAIGDYGISPYGLHTWSTHAPAEEPSGDSNDDFAALATNERGWIGTGLVAAGLIAVAASIVGQLNLFRADGVAGGALLPLSTAPGAIWDNAAAWWQRLGVGAPGHGDPFDYVLWVMSMLGGGNGNAAMVWLLFLAMPLAALAAWFAAAAVTSRRRNRFLAALVWAGAPALQIALNQGRVGALVAHVMIPLVFLALLRATGSAVGTGAYAPGHRPPDPGPSTATAQDSFEATQVPTKPGVNGTPSWTAAAAAGLALAVVTASAPFLLAPSLLLVAAAGLLLGRRGRTVWWSLLPSVALFVPLAVTVIDRPRALLGDPGLPLGSDPASLWQQFLGQPLRFDADGGLAGLSFFGPATGPWALVLSLVIGAPMLVLALAALFVPSRRTRLVRFLWVAGTVLLATGWLAGHVTTAADGNRLVSPYIGPAVSAAVFAFLVAALMGADRLQAAAAAQRTSRARTVVLRSVSTLAAVALAIGPLAGLAAWSTGNLVPARPASQSGQAQASDGAAAGDGNGADSGDSAAGAGNSSQAASADSKAQLGAGRLVAPAPQRSLPATAADRGQGPEQSRALVITAGENGDYTASLVRGSGTTLDGLSAVAAARGILGAPGEEQLGNDDAPAASMRRVVATIAASTGVDPRADLELLGAGFVVLRNSDSAAQLTASRIDAVPGLVAVGQTDAGWLWRVAPTAATDGGQSDTAHRARVVDAAGATVASLGSGPVNVDADVPAGAEGRLVVLAERADPAWTAWVDGRRLTATTSSWAQAFTLPAGGGHLEIHYVATGEPWLGIAQAVVIGLTLLLAIPLPAGRRPTALTRDESALRKEYSHV